MDKQHYDWHPEGDERPVPLVAPQSAPPTATRVHDDVEAIQEAEDIVVAAHDAIADEDTAPLAAVEPDEASGTVALEPGIGPFPDPGSADRRSLLRLGTLAGALLLMFVGVVAFAVAREDRPSSEPRSVVAPAQEQDVASEPADDDSDTRATKPQRDRKSRREAKNDRKRDSRRPRRVVAAAPAPPAPGAPAPAPQSAPQPQQQTQSKPQSQPKPQPKPEPNYPPPPSLPLYHLYDSKSGDHVMTTSSSVASQKEAAGYTRTSVGKVYGEGADGRTAISLDGGTAYIFRDSSPRTDPGCAVAGLYRMTKNGEFFYTSSSSSASQWEASGWSKAFVGYIGAC